VAPVFFAAAIYTILSILINATNPRFAPLRPKLILAIFITSDVVATVVQIVGAALIGVASSRRQDTKVANDILLAGLVVQAFTFLVFIILFALFAARAIGEVVKVCGRDFYVTFGVAVLWFYVRVCFRLAETAQGLFGDLNTHEVYFGTLEFMPVVIAVGVLAVWHPGRCIGKMEGRRWSV
jgi:hypothetical protein